MTASIDDGMLQVEVRDDGIGGADPSGRGLLGINDRVIALGGQFSIESPAGGGTVLTATLPISAVPADTAQLSCPLPSSAAMHRLAARCHPNH